MSLTYAGAKTNVGIRGGNEEAIPTLFLYAFTFSTLKIRGAAHIECMREMHTQSSYFASCVYFTLLFIFNKIYMLVNIPFCVGSYFLRQVSALIGPSLRRYSERPV